MEFTIDKEFYNQFNFDKCYPIEDYINNFSEVMPQIIFDKKESLLDTYIKYFGIIGNQSHAYGAILLPIY